MTIKLDYCATIRQNKLEIIMSKLFSCKDCGSTVSKNASVCPNCGAKVKNTSILTWIAVIFIGFMVMSAFIGVFSGDVSKVGVTAEEEDEVSPSQTLDYFELHENNFDTHAAAMVYVAQDLVKKMMKDPESVEFRNMSYVKASTDLPATVCGEVTGKNSFNGYAGYKKFLLKTDTSEFGIEGQTNNFFDEYNKYCVAQ